MRRGPGTCLHSAFAAVLPTCLDEMSSGHSLDLVGLSEVAGLLGITPAAVTARRRSSGHRPGYRRAWEQPLPFPEPVAELRCGPIWKLEQILQYQQVRQRRSCETPDYGRWLQARRAALDSEAAGE